MNHYNEYTTKKRKNNYFLYLRKNVDFNQEMEPRQAIEEWRIKNNKTQEEMAILLGFKSQQNYNDIKTGRTKKLSIELVSKFKDLSGINLLDLQDASRETVVNDGKSNYLSKRRGQKSMNQPFLVPMVPFKAQAGYVRSFDQIEFLDTLEKYALPPAVDHRGAIWRYFEIGGDSMEPSFHEGDIVLCSQVPYEDWQHIRNFYVYVLITHDGMFIKRVYQKTIDEWVLISENDKLYDQVLIDAKSIRELWVMRRHIVNKAPPPKVFEIKV